MPQLHEREAVMNSAKIELQEFLLDLRKKHDLTDLEWAIVVKSELDSTVDGYLKFALRFERHGERDTPSGRAKE